MDARSIVTPEERAALLTDDLPKFTVGSAYVPLDVVREAAPEATAKTAEDLALAHTALILGRELTDSERIAFRLGYAKGAMHGLELARTIATEMIQRPGAPT